jgi:hypothetical protein
VYFLFMFCRDEIHHGLHDLEQVVPEGHTNMHRGFDEVCGKSFPQVLSQFRELLGLSHHFLQCLFIFFRQTSRWNGQALDVSGLCPHRAGAGTEWWLPQRAMHKPSWASSWPGSWSQVPTCVSSRAPCAVNIAPLPQDAAEGATCGHMWFLATLRSSTY